MRARRMGVAVVFLLASLAYAGPDTITYQGSLLNSLGGPVADGTYLMQFKLFDDAAGVVKRWDETDNVQVTRGLFATILGDSTPFGGLFLSYPDLWLEVTIDVDRSGTFEGDEVFSPRQNLTGVPWACPRLEPNVESPNLIGGLVGNRATSGVVGATIGGGGAPGRGLFNRVTDPYGTVGGGGNNQAGDDDPGTNEARYATVGGGEGNTASGYRATVCGGGTNTASGPNAMVGGGCINTASEWYATVGGGYHNTVSGTFATVPGGRDNTAQGDDSFAAGRGALAQHKGAFVWADSNWDGYFLSQRDDQFLVRANGGVRFEVNRGQWVEIRDEWINGVFGVYRLIDTSQGAYLADGQWTNGSDCSTKERFATVDGRAVLQKVAGLSIATWNRKGTNPAVRHMSPMAQDFYAAFRLGADDKTIGTLDADGVALAAIQGLYQIVQAKDARIVELEARLAALEALVTAKTDDQSGSE